MYFGGGGQGNHLGGAYSGSVQQALGVKYKSNALAQEKTGLAWTSERVLGGGWHGDFEECDVAIIVGKNPWQSNGLQRARISMRDISTAEDRTLVVMDPRRTETAELADIHLAVKPGTDVWCISAILGHMVQNKMLNDEWLAEHANGLDGVIEVLGSVPVADYADFAGIPLEQIIQVANKLAVTDKIAVYEDLGIAMSPYSTLCSYLNLLLFLLRGSFANEGGMHLPTPLVSLFGYGNVSGQVGDDGIESGYATSAVTGARIVCGLIPCNSIPEEILTDHPDRIRAMLIESSNPAHSMADSKKFEEAFKALDFMVVIDVAMTETAALADYVLPASSQYEKFEATFFNFEYPNNFFHLCHPLFEPRPGTLPEPEMHARLVEALGVFEEGELDDLKAAAVEGRGVFAEKLFAAMGESRKIAKYIPYVLYRTLGPTLPEGTQSSAAIWGLSQIYAMGNAEAVHRAGIEGEGLELGDALFNHILNSPSGAIIGTQSMDDRSDQWRKASGKVELGMSEMLGDLAKLTEYKLPERTDEFPLILAAGERRLYTANTAIRDPKWMKSNNPTSLAVNPIDANQLGINDGAIARVVTKRGSAEVVVEHDDRMRAGTLSLPNGLGLNYPNEAGQNEAFGVAPNQLTDLDDRDEWVGTPFHKHVRARLEAI